MVVFSFDAIDKPLEAIRNHSGFQSVVWYEVQCCDMGTSQRWCVEYLRNKFVNISAIRSSFVTNPDVIMLVELLLRV